MTVTFKVQPDKKPIGGMKLGEELPYEGFTRVSAEDMFAAKLGKIGSRKTDKVSWEHSDGTKFYERMVTIEAPKLEGCSDWGPHLIGPSNGLHPLIEATNAAFDHHLPLVLTPDVIWACMAQGLAKAVRANAEFMRHHFVEHEGQEHIEIQRDEFLKGDRNNDWEGCFSEFSQHIKSRVGDQTHQMLLADFSTTDPVSRAVSEIVLMDTMSPFFSYGMRTCCGFPRISLEGDVADWKELRARVTLLREFQVGKGGVYLPVLDWWLDELEFVMDMILASARGNANVEFWKSFYNLGGGSGGPFMNGWINILLPYMRGKKGPVKNPVVEGWRHSPRRGGGPNPSDFDMGLSKVPVKWHYFGTEFDMRFVGGLVGTSIDEEEALRPEFGWCVYDATEAKETRDAPEYSTTGVPGVPYS